MFKYFLAFLWITETRSCKVSVPSERIIQIELLIRRLSIERNVSQVFIWQVEIASGSTWDQKKITWKWFFRIENSIRAIHNYFEPTWETLWITFDVKRLIINPDQSVFWKNTVNYETSKNEFLYWNRVRKCTYLCKWIFLNFLYEKN